MDKGDLNPKPCEDVLDDKNRGKLLLDMGRVLRHPLLFLRVTDPFISSHHPACNHFESHLVTIRGRKWCIGCTFNSISFFSAMLFLFGIWLIDNTFFIRFYLFWGGVFLSIFYFLLSASNITEERKRAKIGSKFLLGTGFAFICWFVLLFEGFFTNLVPKFFIILTLYIGFVTILNIKRSFEIFKECENCEYKMRWSKCPGFRDVACKLLDAEFLHAEVVSE
ncbi:MAG: hypothetical protein E4H14_11800 [Candidatus Thorarchaeota archaeon]|nr:MAG: hypothetical protein E4H14_11800 [Candidatus Thorarchaeota archaeon]